MRLISIVTYCFNESGNVEPLYKRLQEIIKQYPCYRFEIIFIDNASSDDTVAKLKSIAQNDKRVKVIVNMRNFGHIRSPYHAFMQAKGDAVIIMASDFQDPPELIPEFIKHWENGELLVLAVKVQSEENPLLYFVRSCYYKLHTMMVEVETVEHATGFGLYDKRVMDELKKLHEPYPYLRGLVCELGFQSAKVPFIQPARKSGKSKTNFYQMFDLAMTGLTGYSVFPMRIATFTGLALAAVSFCVAVVYLVYKLLNWQSFQAGSAPLLVGMFGIFSLQLVFIGLLGEYVAATHRDLINRPLVVERERINFEYDGDEQQPPSNGAVQDGAMDAEPRTVYSNATAGATTPDTAPVIDKNVVA